MWRFYMWLVVVVDSFALTSLIWKGMTDPNALTLPVRTEPANAADGYISLVVLMALNVVAAFRGANTEDYL